jgi:hypothetical protein
VKHSLTAALLGLSMLAAGLVHAQQTPPAAAPPPVSPAPAADDGFRNPMRACRADLRNLCQDASGIGARLQCLKTNQDKLSPECIDGIRGILGSVQSKAQAAAASGNVPRPLKACQQELAALCPDLTKGEGGRIRCLRDNRVKVSPSCGEALDAAREKVKSVRRACDVDRSRLCGDAGPKQADQMRCLRERQAELTGECREVVAAAKSAAGKAKDTRAAQSASPPPPASGPSGPTPAAAPPLKQ